MEIAKDYLNKLGAPSRLKITGERQELIQRFVDKINLERVGTKFKPVTWKQVNGLVRILKEKDLYWLFKRCEETSSFSKKFFGVLRDTKATSAPSPRKIWKK